MISQPKQLVWFITGTSSGFGHDLVLAALKRGDKVIATARGRSVAKLEPLKEQGAKVLDLDVTASLDAIKEVAKKAIDLYGRIDVVVNNAGYVMVGALEETTPEETMEQFNTNVFGGLNVARAFLPYMRPRKEGYIVWIGSITGWVNYANGGLYSASKFALRGISYTMDVELKPLGLRSIIIEPGYFRTNIVDNRTRCEPRIPDYEEMRESRRTRVESVKHLFPGDSKKGAEVIVDIVRGEGSAEGKEIPTSLLLGSDAIGYVQAALDETANMMETWKDTISSTDFSKPN